MWGKTLVGFPLTLLLSVSLMLNLNFMLPFDVDVRLLISLLAAFALWGSALVLFYRKGSVWPPARMAAIVLVASCALNAGFML